MLISRWIYISDEVYEKLFPPPPFDWKWRSIRLDWLKYGSKNAFGCNNSCYKNIITTHLNKHNIAWNGKLGTQLQWIFKMFQLLNWIYRPFRSRETLNNSVSTLFSLFFFDFTLFFCIIFQPLFSLSVFQFSSLTYYIHICFCKVSYL